MNRNATVRDVNSVKAAIKHTSTIFLHQEPIPTYLVVAVVVLVLIEI